MPTKPNKKSPTTEHAIAARHRIAREQIEIIEQTFARAERGRVVLVSIGTEPGDIDVQHLPAAGVAARVAETKRPEASILGAILADPEMLSRGIVVVSDHLGFSAFELEKVDTGKALALGYGVDWTASESALTRYAPGLAQ